MGKDTLQQSEAKKPAGFRLPNGVELKAPTLRIKEVDATLAFYKNDLGLQVKRRYRDPTDDLELVQLGFKLKDSEEPVLILKNDPNAAATPHNFAGLYHYAVLVPDRKSLASTYLAIANSRANYEGFADHLFSESLYLHDAERNGIEIYADRPKEAWPIWQRMTAALDAGDPRALDIMSKPLDLDSLMSELKSEERKNPLTFPRGARVGHVHLRVTNLERSVRFYRDELGLDVMTYIPQIGAAFLSAGGYHHHIGLNTWHSLGGSGHRSGEAGLESFKIVVDGVNTLHELALQFPGSSEASNQLSISDPDGIRIIVESR